MAIANRFVAAVAVLGVLMGVPGVQAQKLSADGAMQTFNFLEDQFFSDV